MPLIDNYVDVRVTKRNVTHYKTLGYDVPKMGQGGTGFGIIQVRSCDVNKKSKVTYLDFICDNCGCHFKRSAEAYYKRVESSGDTHTYCVDCVNVATKSTMISRYGVATGGQVEGATQKRESTCLEKYGVSHPLKLDKFKEKSRRTCMKKYGVDSPSKTDEARERSRRLFQNNGLVCSSKAQNHICDVVDGKLNYNFHGFYLDILYEDWLDIEYDGSGHDLRVKHHYMTSDEFNKQEAKRFAAIHSYGIKTLVIKGNDRDRLPNDNELRQIIYDKIDLLKQSDDKTATIDFSNIH